jgi:Fe-S oxidoreductase
MKLPVLSARTAETTLCTFCPKLCRPACPVSTVEGRETVTPWGKMRAMGELLRDVAPLDPVHTSPAYACTGCMRCFELCELDNPVAETLRDGRAAAFASHVAPEPVKNFVADFARREASLLLAAEELPAGRGAVAFVPGCTAATFHKPAVRAIAHAIERLDAPCAVLADRCCGLPLLEAGDREGFVERARAMAQRLGSFARVVTHDAGCAHALREIYPSFGIAVPPVRHLSETAASSLASIPALRSPPERVAYHDPCRLGRGLGVYDEPRAVLTRLLGRAPLELADRREYGACSGGGAILPIARPSTASGIAEELAALVREAETETVVTACPTSHRMLSRTGVQALEFGALLASAFE